MKVPSKNEISTTPVDLSHVTIKLAAVTDGPIVIRDSAAAIVVDEKAAEPSESKKCPASITNRSYICRIGKIERLLKISLIYCNDYINSLEW